MIEPSQKVRLNDFFEITNGTKTGIFVIYDTDKYVRVRVNAIHYRSILGRALLGKEIPSQIFLLQTLKNINEGFWITRKIDKAFFENRRKRDALQFGPGRNFLPSRINGHLDRGIIELKSDGNSYRLSEMQPDFNSKSDFFVFATTWSVTELPHREKIRKLKKNLAINIDELRLKTKFFPINEGPNATKKIRRDQCLDFADQLKGSINSKNRYGLNRLLNDSSKFLDLYISEFGGDSYSQILGERIELIKFIFIEKNWY